MKIGILEDSYGKLSGRYSSLAEKHELHVKFYLGGPSFRRNVAENDGLKAQFYPYDSDAFPTDADLYFVGDLNGQALRVIQEEKLPLKKAFLIAGSATMRLAADSRGIQTINREEISDVVARIDGKEALPAEQRSNPR